MAGGRKKLPLRLVLTEEARPPKGVRLALAAGLVIGAARFASRCAPGSTRRPSTRRRPAARLPPTASASLLPSATRTKNHTSFLLSPPSSSHRLLFSPCLLLVVGEVLLGCSCCVRACPSWFPLLLGDAEKNILVVT